MYVGLIVRDECERSVKNQASKDEQVDFVIGSRVSHENEKQSTKDPQKSLFGKKLYFALPSLYPHYIYPLYPQSVMSAFQRENPRKYT